ncbi:MAG: putative toxin-antitoxin system toxin component, PIN family [bacterium]
MKVFFDTNVLIAAFISHGACTELFEHCLSEHRICLSQEVLGELEEKLTGKLAFPEEKVKEVLSFLRENAEVLPSGILPSPVSRDPDDDLILASALGGKADCLVSGDKDLLVLEKVPGLPIISPGDFWRFEKRRGRKRR